MKATSLLLLLLWAHPGLAAEPATPSLVPEAKAETGEDFGSQYLGADRQGRVFLLQVETLEVFRLAADLNLEPHLQLKQPPELVPVGFVKSAAMADDAGTWILLRQDLWLASERDFEPLPPLGWIPGNVTVFKGEPVVSVLPFGIGRNVPRRKIVYGEPSPQLIIQAGNKWNDFADGGVFPTREEYRDSFMGIWVDRALEVASAGNRGVWAADRYRYRIRLLSPAGKELTVIAGDPEIEFEDVDLEEAEGELREQAGPVAVGKSVEANTAISKILGLVEGPMGELYVISTVETLALDRFDPVEGKVERVPLNIDYEGSVSIAAGSDGLYLAAFKGHSGRWFFSWEALEKAPWQAVEGLEIR